MKNIYSRGFRTKELLQYKKNKNNTQLSNNIKNNEVNFPSLTGKNECKLNTKWGKKQNDEENNINKSNACSNDESISKSKVKPIQDLPWKKNIKLICSNTPIPVNYIVGREVCGDDKNVYFNKYTNKPYSDEMFEFLSENRVEKYNVDGWYRECTDYDLYPTRESWIDMWDPDLILMEKGYYVYDSDESDSSIEEPESPYHKNKYGKNKNYVCPTCNYEFPSKQRLEKHMRQSDHGEYFDGTNNNDENW